MEISGSYTFNAPPDRVWALLMDPAVLSSCIPGCERFEPDGEDRYTVTLTIGLAREVADEGIRVNAVRPGFIYTEMHASGGEPNRVDRVRAFVPMKRGGTADEVAHAILWLLSSEASYTTGAFVDVTGGK